MFTHRVLNITENHVWFPLYNILTIQERAEIERRCCKAFSDFMFEIIEQKRKGFSNAPELQDRCEGMPETDSLCQNDAPTDGPT